MAGFHELRFTSSPGGLLAECQDGCGRRLVIDRAGVLTVIDRGSAGDVELTVTVTPPRRGSRKIWQRMAARSCAIRNETWWSGDAQDRALDHGRDVRDVAEVAMGQQRHALVGARGGRRRVVRQGV